MSDDDNPEQLRVYKAARDEANGIISNHVNWAIHSSEDLMRLFRFHLLILGIVFSLLSVSMETGVLDQLGRQNLYSVGLVGAWALLWLVAAGLIVVAHKSLEIAPGPFGDPNVIKHGPETGDDEVSFSWLLEETEMDEQKYYRRLLRDYENKIEYNVIQISRRYSLHVRIFVSMIGSVVVLLVWLAGINQPIVTSSVYQPLAGVLILGSVLLAAEATYRTVVVSDLI